MKTMDAALFGMVDQTISESVLQMSECFSVVHLFCLPCAFVIIFHIRHGGEWRQCYLCILSGAVSIDKESHGTANEVYVIGKTSVFQEETLSVSYVGFIATVGFVFHCP